MIYIFVVTKRLLSNQHERKHGSLKKNFVKKIQRNTILERYQKYFFLQVVAFQPITLNNINYLYLVFKAKEKKIKEIVVKKLIF